MSDLRARLEAFIAQHEHTDFGHEPWWVRGLRALLDEPAAEDDIRAKVERSSLGTPEAQALRATVSDEHAARIVARARELEAREALRVVRLVEADMAEAALKAWHSADARPGLSDHDALLSYADTLTRWSERFRMAFDGEDYRDDRALTTTTRPTDGDEAREVGGRG